jgi:hypothetical protein
MNQFMSRVAPILVGAAGLLACGGDSTSPQSALAGSYSANMWTTTGVSGQTYQLAIGSTLQINLAADGTTTGHMHVAASGGNPAFDADMAGTFTQTGNTVKFVQAADSFINDMIFEIQPIAAGVWDLVGDDTFNGTRVQLTLRHGTY